MIPPGDCITMYKAVLIILVITCHLASMRMGIAIFDVSNLDVNGCPGGILHTQKAHDWTVYIDSLDEHELCYL